ncbi:MAG: C25 family cysteine peptidase, partial [Bacteroidota bacterium]
MRPSLFIIPLLFGITNYLAAQIVVSPGDTLYGNEWLEYGTNYLQISTVEEGIYRLTATDLAVGGFELNEENEDRWALYHQGEQVPVLVRGDGIYFYGQGNDGSLDAFLFENPEQDQLNPAYSLYNDTAAYFLRLTQVPSGGVGSYTEVANGDASTLIPEPYVWRESERIYADHANKTFIRTQGISIFYSHYDRMEGFGSREINDLLSFNGSTESPFELTLPNLFLAGPSSSLSTRFGVAFESHQQSLQVGGTGLTSMTSGGWGVHELSASFTPVSENVSGSLIGSGGERDKASVAWMKARYPATTVLESPLGFRFQLAQGGGAKRLSVTDDNTPLWLFNLTNQTFQESLNPSVGFLLDNPSITDNYFLTSSQGGFLAPTTVQVFTPANVVPNQPIDYLIVTSKRLHNDGNGSDPVADYAAYRTSTIGGNYRVHVVDIEDLYPQFAYGVDRHPLALRNYQAVMQRQHPELQYLFLIGKGREYDDLRSNEQLAAASTTFFLPSFGLPASDNLLTADLGSVVPTLSTGRLSVINADEINIYLEKVREFDAQRQNGQSIDERDWMKQIIHLGGGTTPSEQQSIRNNLGNMEQEIEGSIFGANTSSFFKTSSEPIEESRQVAIFDRINAGTSIISFFGHSSSQSFDFSIDNPENYFNREKYPLMLSLGCYSGDAFTPLRSIGERFVLLPEKGAIAFGASKGLGYIAALGVFARNYYRLLGSDFYGQGIGDVLQANIRELQNQSSFSMRILMEQFSLNGDPALQLNPHPGPDLVIDPASVRFEPRVIPAQQDSFTVAMRLLNLGRGTQDSLTLFLQQALPNGEVADLGRFRMLVPPYVHELSLRLPNQGFEAIGVNRLLARVDVGNEVVELPLPLAETNNSLVVDGQEGASFFVVSNTARPASPPPYALHLGTELPELIASTTNPLAVEQRYFLEIDTSQFFAAPLARTEITQSGGLIRWQPNLAYQDSAVYYWRISPDSVNTEGSGLIWNSSSFTYLADNDRPGWAAAHQGQMNDGKYVNIRSAGNREQWNFARSFNDIRVRNKVYDSNDVPSWEFNGQAYASPWPWIVRAGIQMIVIDSINNDRWLTNPPGGAHGSTSNGSPQDVWGYDTRTQEGRAAMMDFIDNVVEDGKYVVLYTSQRGNDLDYKASEWINDSLVLGQTLFGVLERQGALQVRQLANLGAVPYVFAFQKGVGPIGEDLAESQEGVADLLFN